MKKSLKILLILTIAFTLLIFFVACDPTEEDGKSSQVKLGVPQNIVVKGNIATWEEVSEAKKYKVEAINEKKEKVVNEVVESSSYDFTPLLNELTFGKYNFKVQSIADDSKFNSEFSASVELFKLATPTELAFSKDILSWGGVEKANSYKVLINKNIFKNISATNFNLLDTNLTNYSDVQVQADGADNVLSSAFVKYSGNISSVGELNLKLGTKELRWDSLSGIKEYRVKHHDDETPKSLGTSTSFKIEEEKFYQAGVHTFYLYAISSSDNVASICEKIELTAVAPAVISIENGKLKVDNIHPSVFDLDILYANVEEGLPSENNFKKLTLSASNLIELEALDSSNGNLFIKVFLNENAQNNILGSRVSNLIENVSKFSKPIVEFSSDYLYLDKLEDTSAKDFKYYYEIRQGEDIKLKAFTPEKEISLSSAAELTAGQYSVVVKKVLNSQAKGCLNSNFSDPVIFDALERPELRIENKSVVWEAKNGVKYKIIKGNSPAEEVNESFNDDGTYRVPILSSEEGINTIKVQAYSQNAVSSMPYSISYEKLVKPEVSVTINGILQWNENKTNRGYRITIKNKATNESTIISNNFTSIILETLASGIYVVQVEMLGDEKEFFESDFSNEIVIEKLPIPEITTLDSDSKNIGWKSIDKDGVEYQLEFRGDIIPTSNTSMSLKQYFQKYPNLKLIEVKLRTIAKNNSDQLIKYVQSDWVTGDKDIEPEDYYSGYGTPESPFIISNFNELKKIVNNPSSHFILLNNIHCDNNPWPQITNFTGTIDGGNYTIYNLQLSVFTNKIGFIGELGNNGKIKNLKLENARMSASNLDVVSAGFLVGEVTANNAVIENCTVSGVVEIKNVKGLFVGGICGSTNGSIKNSEVKITLNVLQDVNLSSAKENYIGGLAGKSFGDISDCKVTLGSRIIIKTLNQKIMIGGAVGSIGKGVQENKVQRVDIGGKILVESVADDFNLGGFSASSDVPLTKIRSNINLEMKNSKASKLNVAGITGSSLGAILRSYSIGDILVDLNENPSSSQAISIGGLVGMSNAIIRDSYSKSKIIYKETFKNKDIFIGGLVSNANADIINCYVQNIMQVDNWREKNVGAIAGENRARLISVYFDKEANSFNSDVVVGNVNEAEGCTPVKMYSKSTYKGWDFNDQNGVWIISGSNTPELR